MRVRLGVASLISLYIIVEVRTEKQRGNSVVEYA
jgi:hypothetical protein